MRITSLRNCVGAGARVSGFGSHTGTPRNQFSNAFSSGLKRVMFSILFSYKNSSQSAVNDCASVARDRKSTRLNSSHLVISYAVFCLKKKNKKNNKSYSDKRHPSS